MKYPTWVLSKPRRDEKKSARLLYHFRIAAIHHNQDGSIPLLAQAINYSPNSIMAAINRGHISRGMAACLERKFDQEVFPTAQLHIDGLIK